MFIVVVVVMLIANNQGNQMDKLRKLEPLPNRDFRTIRSAIVDNVKSLEIAADRINALSNTRRDYRLALALRGDARRMSHALNALDRIGESND